MPRDIAADLAKARDVQQKNAAIRALDDPIKLQRAARIVRVALERRRLTLEDIRPADQGPEAA